METDPNPQASETPDEVSPLDPNSNNSGVTGTPLNVTSPVHNKTEGSRTPSESRSLSEEDNVEVTFPEERKGDGFEIQHTHLADAVKIDIKSDEEGEDTPTLPLHKKNKGKAGDSKGKLKEKPSMYLFPITRLKLAWTRSSNVLEFMIYAVAIIFSTLGWFCCVGGIPFMSLAMLIVGSIYVDDCNIEPNIPVYLIVSGVLGTVQHVIAVWTKYVPKETQGRLKVYRAYCKVVDYILNIFLAIWFIIGCVWVYGNHSEVVFEDTFKNEYCHKTLYLFAFWVLNLSFIFLCLLIVGSLCCVIFIVAAPKDEDVAYVQ